MSGTGKGVKRKVFVFAWPKDGLGRWVVLLHTVLTLYRGLEVAPGFSET